VHEQSEGQISEQRGKHVPRESEEERARANVLGIKGQRRRKRWLVHSGRCVDMALCAAVSSRIRISLSNTDGVLLQTSRAALRNSFVVPRRGGGGGGLHIREKGNISQKTTRQISKNHEGVGNGDETTAGREK